MPQKLGERTHISPDQKERDSNNGLEVKLLHCIPFSSVRPQRWANILYFPPKSFYCRGETAGASLKVLQTCINPVNVF